MGKKRYLISGFAVMEKGYIVEAESESEALEIAMEMEIPTYTELVEEGYFDPEELRLS